MIEPTMALLVWDRILETYVLADLLEANDFLAPRMTEQEVLEFLLIDSWEAIGLCRLRSHLYEN